MKKSVCDYDECSVSEGLIEANLIMGKRGRPPRRLYCPEHFEQEKEAGNCKAAGPKLSKEEREHFKQLARTRKPRQNTEGIKSVGVTHPEAEFLVTSYYENMFEPILSRFESILDALNFRCKCCDERVGRTERREHYAYHQGKDYQPEEIPVIEFEDDGEEDAREGFHTAMEMLDG